MNGEYVLIADFLALLFFVATLRNEYKLYIV